MKNVHIERAYLIFAACDSPFQIIDPLHKEAINQLNTMHRWL